MGDSGGFLMVLFFVFAATGFGMFGLEAFLYMRIIPTRVLCIRNIESTFVYLRNTSGWLSSNRFQCKDSNQIVHEVKSMCSVSKP